MTYIGAEKYDKYPKFKVRDHVRRSKLFVKIFLQKAIFQIVQKKFLGLKKLKILFRGHILLVM